MIPEAKITALREALERDGTVTFKNGSVVEREVDRVPCPDAEAGADGEPAYVEEVHFVVKRGYGGSTRFADSDTEIRRAYEMALNGPRPKQQPPERDYGPCPY